MAKRRVQATRAGLRRSRRREARNFERMERRRLLATFLVDTFFDVVDDGDNLTSLREAISMASATPEADTIQLPDQIGGMSGPYLLNGVLDIDSPQGALSIQASDGPVTIDAQETDSVFIIPSAGEVEFVGLVITGGSPALNDPGGGIRNNGGTLTLIDSLVVDNSTPANGGGIFNTGTLTLIRTTVSDNQSFGGDGGGLSNDGTATLINSTISNNEAVAEGAGIATDGNLTITNSTIAQNRSVEGMADGIFISGGATTLTNTIVADDPDGGGGVAILGVVESSSSHNVISTANGLSGISDGVNGNQIGVDPMLGPLQDNGGLTETHALPLGSPAVDAGTVVGGVTTDQRGVARPQGPAFDVGSFELEQVEPPSLVVTTADDVVDPDDFQTSLREAILFANTDPDPDAPELITFAIPGTGPHTIAVRSQLPDITGTLRIDGYSQPGASPNTLAVGSDAVLQIVVAPDPDFVIAAGLRLTSADNSITGLVINGFDDNGIEIDGAPATGNVIGGNYIGTDVAGATIAGNGGNGISLTNGAAGNVIGGDSPSDRNVIGGNGTLFDPPQTLSGVTGGVDLVADEGFDDLIVGVDNSPSTGFLQPFQEGGDGVFFADDPISLPAGVQPVALDVGEDPNDSGRGFIYVATGTTGTGLVLVQRDFSGVLATIEVPRSFAGADPRRLAVGDLDNDDIDDVVIVNEASSSAGNEVRVLFGNGDGTFSGVEILGTGLGISDVAVGSFFVPAPDPDSPTPPPAKAVIAVSVDADAALIYRSNDDGTFQAPIAEAVGTDPSAVHFEENTEEIYVANAGSNDVTILSESGDFTFFDEVVSVGDTPVAIAVADVDDDFEDDIITANSGDGTITVLRRRPNFGSFRDPIVIDLPDPIAVDGGFTNFNSSEFFFENAAALSGSSGGAIVLQAREPIDAGVLLEGAPGNRLQGNVIGVGADGETELANVGHGVRIVGAADTTIGGTAAGDRNVISGNEFAGIRIGGPTGDESPGAAALASGTLIQGNSIGMSADGLSRLGNSRQGIRIVGDVPDTTIGGLSTEGAGNLISGNFRDGVEFGATFPFDPDTGTTVALGPIRSLIQGNLIGTDIAGEADFGNSTGVDIFVGRDNSIGGTVPGARNLISGNSTGIRISGSSSRADGGGSGNLIQGNYIGTDLDGTAAVGNFTGISLSNAPLNTIGGPDPSMRNVISGNFGDGIRIFSSTLDSSFPPLQRSSGNVIEGNFIGVDATGTQALGNAQSSFSERRGVIVQDTPDLSIRGNTISGNQGVGLLIERSGSTGIIVAGNLIGVGSDGATPVPNDGFGVSILDGDLISIGGAANGEGNVISGNLGDGIFIGTTFDSAGSADANVVRGNFIGTDATGTVDRGNSGHGVHISNGSGNAIGGTDPGEGNVISGNDRSGVFIGTTLPGGDAAANVVQGNLIGTNAGGATTLGNGENGVTLTLASSATTIGGMSPAARNVISNNSIRGIEISGESAGNLVQGNYIGTDASGSLDLGNGVDGIALISSGNNTIGGPIVGQGNTISGNATNGVRLLGVASGNVLQGNVIGAGAEGSSPLPNGGAGISIRGDASFNTIGGLAGASANVVAFNGGDGIEVVAIESGGPLGNSFLGNSIFANGGLGIDLGGDGPTLNDPGDADEGPNRLRNFPLLSASPQESEIAIDGTFDATIPGSHRVEFFADAGDPSGFGEGERFLGSVEVISGGSRVEAFSLTIPSSAIDLDAEALTATVTGPEGNTSEFSMAAVRPTDLAIDKAGPEAVDVGSSFDYSVVVRNEGTNPAFSVVATDALPDGLIFVSAVASRGTVSESEGVVVATIGDLSPGEVAAITITVLAPIEGTFVNADTVEAQTFDPNPDNDDATFATTVIDPVEPDFVVRNTDDAGLGSLRQVILDANEVPGAQTITFAIPAEGPGVFTIRPESPLPTIVEAVTIDARTQPGGPVELDGSLAGEGADGLVVTGGGSVIAGLVINRFAGSGVVLSGLGGNRVIASRIGTDAAATTDLGNGLDGIAVFRSGGNMIGGSTPGEGNVISGNDRDGISFRGLTLVGNGVVGNLIGTNGNGLLPIPNANAGIMITDGAGSTTIGGATPGSGNVISGNGRFGVAIVGPPVQMINTNQVPGGEGTGNVVLGNQIGVAAGAPGTLPNGQAGVYIDDSPRNLVGGLSPGARNVISGGDGAGVWIVGPGSIENVVENNAIGTDASGTTILGGDGVGVLIERGASSNIVGGPGIGAGNVIAAHLTAGVGLTTGAASNQVRANQIGSFGEGRGGNGNGVLLQLNATGNQILENVIGGNLTGVTLNFGAVANVVVGNLLGTDPTGTTAFGNPFGGVVIRESRDNIIGGTGSADGNLIAGNIAGLVIEGAGASGNRVIGNVIGSGLVGPIGPANSSDGIFIDEAPGNIIGGDQDGAGNLIASNGGAGIQLFGEGAGSNVIAGNTIARNGSVGIFLNGAPGNIIGGPDAAANQITENGTVGIQLEGPGASGNRIAGNRVGVDMTGRLGLGNGISGIFLRNAPGNVIGGASSAEANIVGGHLGAGIQIVGPGASGNLIRGNRVGTDVDGADAIPNQQGITIDNAPGNTIGGDRSMGLGNLVSGNTLGVVIAGSGASGNVVQGNFIGTDRTGTQRLANRNGGVFLNNAPGNIIGGAGPDLGNVISGNGVAADLNNPGAVGLGVQVFNVGASGNLIAGNIIGLSVDLDRPLANIDAGIFLNDAPLNTVGGSAGLGNVISGNRGSGVVVSGPEADDNVVMGNIIGTPDAGDSPATFGNDVGLFLNGVGDVTTGGGPEEQNTIRGNRATDVLAVSEDNGPQVIAAEAVLDPTGGTIAAFRFEFSRELIAGRANNPRNYLIRAGAVRVGIDSVRFDRLDRSVTIVPNRALPADRTYRVRLDGTSPGGLADTRGLLIDGDLDGDPGGNFVAAFVDGQLQSGPARTGLQARRFDPSVVDDLLGRGLLSS